MDGYASTGAAMIMRNMKITYSAHMPEAIGKLMEALVIVGVAMSFVGNSHPACGSEHHLSHYFELTGILNNEDYFLHGIDVVYSAVQTQLLREKILKLKQFPEETYVHDPENWEK